MGTTRATVSVSKVWVQFQKGKIRAELVKVGKKMSTVRYMETFKFPSYKAKRGEKRVVANMFISSRKTR